MPELAPAPAASPGPGVPAIAEARAPVTSSAAAVVAQASAHEAAEEHAHLHSAPALASVTARAHGKVNLSLHVGPVGADGYHPLRSIFQALDLTETVVARVQRQGGDEGFERPGSIADAAGDTSEIIRVTVAGIDAQRVPRDETNLAVRAARALAAFVGRSAAVDLHLVKGVPVAGGMAGGSADAAATLVALDALWGTGLTREQLTHIGAGLGADVPFTLSGGTACGLGRGEQLSPVPTSGNFHWVLAVRDEGLSTAAVYQAFDELDAPSTLDSGLDAELRAGLAAGDPATVGPALHNSLEPVATRFVPPLARTIAAAREAGAAGAVISGSGPTVAVLLRNEADSAEMMAALAAAGTSDRRLQARSLLD